MNRDRQTRTSRAAPAPGDVIIFDRQRQPTAEIDTDGAYVDVWPPRLPSSSRRYNMPALPGKVIEHQKPLHVPARRSAQQATEETRTSPTRARRRPHWFVIAGLSAMVVIVLIWGGTSTRDKWIDTQNDWTYTATFRTFSIDQAVGHNGDSAARPSHFIVQNDKRRIVIVEFPADDPGKVIVYYGPVLLGDGQDKTPVTLSFQMDSQTGRVDMVLHVEDQQYVFPNNGQKFMPPAA